MSMEFYGISKDNISNLGVDSRSPSAIIPSLIYLFIMLKTFFNCEELYDFT